MTPDCKLKEPVGKVFKTECFLSTCECGELIKQERFAQLKEGTNEMEGDMFMGVCGCGNIAVAQFPQLLPEIN